jgi:hypothetical protein
MHCAWRAAQTGWYRMVHVTSGPAPKRALGATNAAIDMAMLKATTTPVFLMYGMTKSGTLSYSSRQPQQESRPNHERLFEIHLFRADKNVILLHFILNEYHDGRRIWRTESGIHPHRMSEIVASEIMLAWRCDFIGKSERWHLERWLDCLIEDLSAIEDDLDMPRLFCLIVKRDLSHRYILTLSYRCH